MLKREVLAAFKELHSTRKMIFEGDSNALEVIRKKINEGFAANKEVTSLDTIKQHIQLAYDVNNELKANVVQAIRTDDGNYRVKMHGNIKLTDTKSPYKPMPEEMIGPFKRKKTECSDFNK